MRKLITISFVGMFGILSFSSCAKVYKCECYSSYSADQPVTSTTIMATKKTAKRSCENSNSASTGMTCKLK